MVQYLEYTKLCYFLLESGLNKLAAERYEKNICQCVRQWHYSKKNNNSVDMVLMINPELFMVQLSVQIGYGILIHTSEFLCLMIE